MPNRDTAIEDEMLVTTMEGGLSNALDGLSWMQRQMKKGSSHLLSGQADETAWFEANGMNPHLYASINTAGDILADPLNVIPFNHMARLGAAIPNAARKGGMLSSAKNYIKNMYGPYTDSSRNISALEQMAIPDAKSVMKEVKPYQDPLSDEQALALVRKAKGLAQWGADGLWAATKSAMSPYHRAQWVDNGINANLQKDVKNYRDSVSKNKEKEVHARRQAELTEDPVKKQELMNDAELYKKLARTAGGKAGGAIKYNQHIAAQAQRQGKVHAVLKEFEKKAYIQGYKPNDKGTISSLLQEHPGTATKIGNKKAKPLTVPTAFAEAAEDHINKVNFGDTIVMNQPTTGMTGNHYNDVIYNSALPTTAEKVFKALGKNPSPDAMYDYLKSIWKKGDDWYLKTASSKQALEEGGVMITGSKVGSAVTEGGINWLGMVEPDGNLMGIMSDKHDFLNQFKPAEKFLKWLLPEDLTAITPVMRGNVYAIKNKTLSKIGKPNRVNHGVSAKTTDTMGKMYDDFMNAKPTDATLRHERNRTGLLTTAPIAAYHHPTATEDN